MNSCLPAILPFCLATIFISGCAHAQAKVTPDAPLDVPAPPPRDVEVTDSEPPPPATLVPEPARTAPTRPRPTPPREQPRAEAPKPPEPQKPDVPPADAPKPSEEAKPPAPAPATPLQTTPPTADGELERAIRASIAHASADLNRVDYRALNRDARTQYDGAKRLLQQADGALREKNLLFARNLADKAAVIAAQLAGR